MEVNTGDYTDEDVQRIRQILLYRKMGISVETIELILKGSSSWGDFSRTEKGAGRADY